MDKNVRVILIFLIIAGFIYILWPRPQKPGFSAPGAVILPASGEESTRTMPVNRTETKVYERAIDAVNKRIESSGEKQQAANPFRKFELRDLMDRKTLEFSELKLIGIVESGGVPTALINDRILRTGDEISGFQVTEIRSSEVILVRGLEKYTLRLSDAP